MKTAIRDWCAKAQYPGLKPFILGTIVMPSDARHDEIIAALEAHAMTFLTPRFTIMAPTCGALVFQAGD